MPIKNTKPTTTQTPEVTSEEVIETVTHLDDSENSSVLAYATSVVILEKAIETHNGAGISVIDMFESARLRLTESGMPKKDVLQNVYSSAMIVANLPEIEINGTMEAISARANKRMQKELKAVFSYYNENLSIRHQALPFTTFEKLVSLHEENSKTMTKSKIKGCLSVYPKADKMALLTDTQIKDLDSKYVAKVKNLIVMVEAMNLAGEFDSENIPQGFDKILKIAEGLDAGAINNMINGLKVAKNASEGIFKAS